MTKLAAIYNVWDGEELLPYSMQQIQPFVDCIIIVYQTESNYGERYTPLLPDTGTINVHYERDERLTASANETRKRNLGLDVARAENCTHFITMDCDEIYDGLTFNKWKQRAIQFDASACKMLTYYKYPNIRLSPHEQYYVPFICKLAPHTVLGVPHFPVLVDPTRTVSTCKNFFQIDEPIMHHFSWVRNDIGLKLRNSSARRNFRKSIEQMVQEFNDFDTTGQMVHFDQHHWVKVANRFNLPFFGKSDREKTL